MPAANKRICAILLGLCWYVARFCMWHNDNPKIIKLRLWVRLTIL